MLKQTLFLYTLGGKKVTIRIVPNSYCRRVSFPTELAETLKSKIPFKHTSQAEAEFRILDGSSHRRIVTVKMTVNHDLEKSAAETQLKEAGFKLDKGQFNEFLD